MNEVPGIIAIYDSCVLYPAPLRDLLIRLAQTGLYRAHWTEAIHEEWITNLLEARPDLSRAQLERTRRLMDAAVRDCLIAGYEGRIDSLTLPDPDDRHVLAAAIEAQAQVIVTFNLRDFPASALQPYGLEAQHPDNFIFRIIALNPLLIRETVETHQQALQKPPKTPDQYFDTLSNQGLSKTVAALKQICFKPSTS
ncbi:MAG: PIN domain-containing protein [Acidobacteriota bacterium]|nr:PIN domain-containing protein [Acidobacteriota bacterium]